MRLGPLVAFHAARSPIPTKASTDLLLKQTVLSSRITHGSPLSIESAVLMASYLLGFYHCPFTAAHERKWAILSPKYVPPGLLEAGDTLAFKTEEVKKIWEEETFKHYTAQTISTSGFTIDTLEAALWALWNANSFEEVRYRECF